LRSGPPFLDNLADVCSLFGKSALRPVTIIQRPERHNFGLDFTPCRGINTRPPRQLAVIVREPTLRHLPRHH
jgi:hypothetical protein